MSYVGFSTGALAKGDVKRGVELQCSLGGNVIELSALRERELDRFLSTIDDLPLQQFNYISVHAPSRIERINERILCERLAALPPSWPIIIHPDLISTIEPWEQLGARACIENMDLRKPTGQRADDLEPLMRALPEAGFCLDIAHAVQVDPTMDGAKRLLDRFGERLVQVHVSRLGPASEHLPLDGDMMKMIQQIAGRIQDTTPLVIESVVGAEDLEREISRVTEAFGR